MVDGRRGIRMPRRGFSERKVGFGGAICWWRRMQSGLMLRYHIWSGEEWSFAAQNPRLVISAYTHVEADSRAQRIKVSVSDGQNGYMPGCHKRIASELEIGRNW